MVSYLAENFACKHSIALSFGTRENHTSYCNGGHLKLQEREFLLYSRWIAYASGELKGIGILGTLDEQCQLIVVAQTTNYSIKTQSNVRKKVRARGGMNYVSADKDAIR